MGKMRGEYKLPEGLYYFSEFISANEEKKLLHFIDSLEFQEVRIHGQAARRTVVHYGYSYNYETAAIESGEEFPKIIKKLSRKCAKIANVDPEEIVQCLISKYPPAATIGWHRDKFMFGPKVIGISLKSSCTMRFQFKEDDKRYVYEQELEPRSGYILSGKARYKWEHSIPAVAEIRYSITFRTLK